MTKDSADARIRQKSAHRREEQRLELRRAILDAAGELFQEGGLEAVSLRKVAERIGYSPTTIYHHFSDKDALLLEVVLEGFETFGQRLVDAAATHDDPVDRLEAIGRAYVQFGLAHPAHYRLMFMERGEFLTRRGSEGGRPIIDSFGVLVDAVESLIASGRTELDDPEVLAGLLWSGVHGIVALAVATPTYDDTQAWAITDAYFPTIMHGLTGRKGASR